MHEEQLRRKSKVLVKQKDLVFEPTAMGNLAYVVDPRIGCHSKRSASLWRKSLRASVPGRIAIFTTRSILSSAARAKVIVEDKEFDFDTLDDARSLFFSGINTSIPVASRCGILGINTRLAMDNLGLSLTHQERARRLRFD